MRSQFPTRVAGIPCLVNVLSVEPYRPAKLWGPPEDCYPAEGGECEWELLDRKGHHAPWLERKLTREDNLRIEREIERWWS